MRKYFQITGVVLLFFSFCRCTQKVKNGAPEWPGRPDTVIADPSATYLSPSEEMKQIFLPEGYHLELVASEPMVEEPVTIVWDGNGAMYVAEMDTYMKNIDGTGEFEPICRIKKLVDTDGDGKMDKSTVFIDSLVLPRMMLCVGHRLLVNETNSYDIWSYTDTDGDGKADKKELVYENDKADTRNLEHQKSGLVWNIDNWIYVSCDPVRYRYESGKLVVDSLANSPGGQWGLAHDDDGRLYFSSAGAEIPALEFQINPAYGLLNPRDQYVKGFQEVFPVIASPDAKPGARHWRQDSSLNHFTASCGQSVFRGDQLPEDLRGDLLICEPAGRLIRRAKVSNIEGKIVLSNAYDRQEFITSTDMNFRPIYTATGPDGCLYIVDMNHGIIQEKAWVDSGSLIRKVIRERGLDKNIGHGRIFRLVHDGYKRDPRPDILDAPGEKLVTYLGNPNGWWRDNAQKELIVRGDRSVIPALRKMAEGGSFLDKLIFWKQQPDALARLHALWTLEGLHAIDKELLFRAFKDDDAQVRRAAIRISEPYLRNNDEEVLRQLSALRHDPSPDVHIQLIESLFCSTSEEASTLTTQLIKDFPEETMLGAVLKSLRVNKNTLLFGATLAKMPEANRKLVLQGAVIFKQLCSSCHGPDGRGLSLGGSGMAAPPFVGSQEVSGPKEKLIRILLNGLKGPIDGKKYPDEMAPLGAPNSDEWVASVLSYVRHSFAKPQAGFHPIVKPEDVKKIRASVVSRKEAWTLQELNKMGAQ